MIQSTCVAEPLLKKERDSSNDVVSLKLACMHCKIRLKEKDGHPSSWKILKVNRYDTVAELKEHVYQSYTDETYGHGESCKLVPYSGSKQNIRKKFDGSKMPYSMKGVLSKNLVMNVANGRLDNYTLNELRMDECDVIYVLFTYPGQDHLQIEPLLRIVSQAGYNPLKNQCQCSWREDINADSVAMLTTILKTHYIFANIPWRKEKHSAHEFAQSFKAMTFIADDKIITQGENGDNFYVIESGYVDIVKNGKKIVTLGPLDAFGKFLCLCTLGFRGN